MQWKRFRHQWSLIRLIHWSLQDSASKEPNNAELWSFFFVVGLDKVLSKRSICQRYQLGCGIYISKWHKQVHMRANPRTKYEPDDNMRPVERQHWGLDVQRDCEMDEQMALATIPFSQRWSRKNRFLQDVIVGIFCLLHWQQNITQCFNELPWIHINTNHKYIYVKWLKMYQRNSSISTRPDCSCLKCVA